MKVRYALVKRQGDKTFQDYIKSLVEVMREKGLVLIPVKHLPRKLKKTFKRLGSWEFELEEKAEKLLEILCTLSQSYLLNYEGWSFFSVQGLKETILEDCIYAAKKLSLSSVFANKIQKLFKEQTNEK